MAVIYTGHLCIVCLCPIAWLRHALNWLSVLGCGKDGRPKLRLTCAKVRPFLKESCDLKCFVILNLSFLCCKNEGLILCAAVISALFSYHAVLKYTFKHLFTDVHTETYTFVHAEFLIFPWSIAQLIYHVNLFFLFDPYVSNHFPDIIQAT